MSLERLYDGFVMFCASVSYPLKENTAFDFDYFAKHHVPLFARLLGNNCVKYEVQKSIASPGAPTPLFLCSAYFWVKSEEEFGKTLAQHGKEIYGDIPHFTTLEPVRQWNEVVETV